MYLLIDECCGKSLIQVAASAGHTAQRTIDVAVLGRGAADRDIFDFARRNGAIVVTVNRGDFIDLANPSRDHPGVILVPSVPAERLRPLFLVVLAVAETVFAQGPNRFVEIDAVGAISWFVLPTA